MSVVDFVTNVVIRCPRCGAIVSGFQSKDICDWSNPSGIVSVFDVVNYWSECDGDHNDKKIEVDDGIVYLGFTHNDSGMSVVGFELIDHGEHAGKHIAILKRTHEPKPKRFNLTEFTKFLIVPGPSL